MPVTNPDWEVSVEDIKQRLDRGDAFLLIDVRQPDEHRICRLPGARLVPLAELPTHLDELRDLADEKPIVTYCHHGGRSLSAASTLRENGLSNTRSMAGGIDEWSVRIDPAVPRY